MQVIRDFVVFFSLLSLSTHFHLLLANTNPFEHPNRSNESDYEALLAIKARISDYPNSFLASWNNSLPFCHWEGVTCGRRHKRVVSLSLNSRKLVGTLSPLVGNLSFLHVLNLSENYFQGDIPHQISHLRRLRVLDLEKNSFQGEIPSNLSSCLHLEILYLGHNQLVGQIPTELTMLPKLTHLMFSLNNFSGSLQAIGIGNMSSSLQALSLDQNHLKGSIPDDFARLKSLEYLSLGDNLLFGSIPASLLNLSSLKELYLSNTKILGPLPQDLGIRLPRLQNLYFTNSSLVGQLPTSLSNLTELQVLDISFNSFIGGFSLNGKKLSNLYCLHIQHAFSLGGEARDLSSLDTLTNCTKLEHLTADGNSFIGSLSHSILGLSTSLLLLSLSSNQISGRIPLGLGKFVKLYYLNFGDNRFIGPIPTDIGNLESMEILALSHNNFSEEIPSSLGNLARLSDLSLEYNNLDGSLPKSLGNCQNLQRLYLGSNKLSGDLPVELFHASSLIDLHIGQNNLQGSLPLEVVKLQSLVSLVVSQNRFLGEIPNTLGNLTSLTVLDMGRNFFVGSIPESLSLLKSIQVLDLSCNKLSGEIPSYLSTWSYSSSLNLSFNNLEGEVPTNGVFASTKIVSVVGNSKLCGGVPALHLPRCPPRRKSKRRSFSLATIIIISIGCVSVIVLSLALCLYLLCSSRKRKDASSELCNIKPFLKVSYQQLSRATNGFSPSNLIGVGGFGSVYKGILHQDGTEMVVAVKVMNLENEGACKSFIAECKTLKNIRHRNLLRIITACSSIDTQRNDFKALVYEFIPKGSLESWLHSYLVTSEQSSDKQSCSLSLLQRVSVAIDVGCAVDYLHTECTSPIIHCDLKPTNILLDDEMTAHVGDFGLTKFLSTTSTSSMVNPTSTTQVRGTIGYAAPEYGLGSKVSPEGDIYSFGIVILEMMTSKKPTDPMFNEGLNLHDFAKSALPDRVMEIIDQRMLSDSNELSARSGAHIREIECIKSVIMVGVQCSLELPRERMSIKNAVNELNSARQNLL